MDRFTILFLIVLTLSWPSLQSAPLPNPKPDPKQKPAPKPLPIQNPVPGNPIQAICAKAPKPEDCIKKINSDPRNDLKSTPEGIATILFEEAKGSVPETIKFIQKTLPTVKDPTVKDQMKGCLQAYKSVGRKMKMKPNKLKKPEGRTDAVDSLTTAEQDISYDCEWEQLPIRPPEVNQMTEKVQDLSNSIEAATSILSKP